MNYISKRIESEITKLSKELMIIRDLNVRLAQYEATESALLSFIPRLEVLLAQAKNEKGGSK